MTASGRAETKSNSSSESNSLRGAWTGLQPGRGLSPARGRVELSSPCWRRQRCQVLKGSFEASSLSAWSRKGQGSSQIPGQLVSSALQWTISGVSGNWLSHHVAGVNARLADVPGRRAPASGRFRPFTRHSQNDRHARGVSGVVRVRVAIIGDTERPTQTGSNFRIRDTPKALPHGQLQPP